MIVVSVPVIGTLHGSTFFIWLPLRRPPAFDESRVRDMRRVAPAVAEEAKPATGVKIPLPGELVVNVLTHIYLSILLSLSRWWLPLSLSRFFL